jgi:predicted transcriptional regulator
MFSMAASAEGDGGNGPVPVYTMVLGVQGLPEGPVAPGVELMIDLTVIHDAPVQETVQLSVQSAPDGWDVAIGRRVLEVPPAMVAVSQVKVSVGERAQPGEYPLVVEALPSNAEIDPVSITFSLHVDAVHALRIVSPPQPVSATMEGYATTSAVLANDGNQRFNLIEVMGHWGRPLPFPWKVECEALPQVIPPLSELTVVFRVGTVHGAEMPTAGDHGLDIVLTTDVPGFEAEMTIMATVGEVRDLQLEEVPPHGTDGTIRVNPYHEPTGLTYIEVTDLGNLGGYRKASFSAEFNPPVIAVEFTHTEVSLWTGTSRLVETSITVAEATSPGTYSVRILITDVTGARASTEVMLEVYHISARIGGTLSVRTPGGKVASDSLTVRTDEEVILSGTVINDGQWIVPYSEVRIYDKFKDQVTHVGSVPIEDLIAREVRRFEFTFIPREPGDHELEARLQVTGAAPGGPTTASLKQALEAKAVPSLGEGALLLPLLLGTLAGLGVGVLAILGTEVGRYLLLAFFLFPLYTRLKPQQVKDHFIRGQILGYVKANPGETYSSIRKVLGLSNGLFVYHVRILETAGLIRSVKDGANRRFYPAEMRIPTEVKDVKLNQVQRIIYTIVLEHPGISQRRISKLVSLSPSTVNYHVNIMTKIGILERKRSGRLTLIFAAEGID